MKWAPVHKTVKTTNSHDYLDKVYGISNDRWSKELTVKIFGILVFKATRYLTVDSKILDKESKPLGFKES